MSRPDRATDQPVPDRPVSDAVLAELGAAFDDHPMSDVEYDFDDPSIDRLLGIDPSQVSPAAPSTNTPATDTPATDTPATDTPATDTPATDRLDAPAEEPVEDDDSAEESPERSPAPIIVISDDGQYADTVHLDPVYLEDLRREDLRREEAPSGAGSHADQHTTGFDPSASSGSAPSATIVIDHLDDQVDAIPVRSASTTIDPRLRARRAAVDRAAGRRRLLWFAVVAGVVLIVVAVLAVLGSTVFDVRNVTVQSEYTDQAVIDRVVAEMRGTPILRLDTQRFERELEASPWVDTARVSTNFPHDVLIDIRERHPQATFAGSDGRWRVIDRDGRVLAVLDGRPSAYMLLTGAAPDVEVAELAGPAFAAAAQLVVALPPEIRAVTSSVGVDASTGDLSLALDAPDAPGVAVRLGNVTGIEDKLARLLKLVRDGLTAQQQLDVSTANVGT